MKIPVKVTNLNKLTQLEIKESSKLYKKGYNDGIDACIDYLSNTTSATYQLFKVLQEKKKK